MALSDIVRSGIKLANDLTTSLQVEVRHSAWISQNEAGEPQFDTPVVRKALHERRQKLVWMADGTKLMAFSTLTFIGPIAENGAEGRREPVDPRDLIEFFNGERGKILDVAGLDDPLTGRPYLYQVYLG